MTTARAKAALRKAGYVRLPTLWVLPDEAEAIHKIASKHNQDVKRIEREANNPKEEY